MIEWGKALLFAMIMFSMYNVAVTLDDDSLNNMFSNVNNTIVTQAKDAAIATGEKVGYFGLFAQTLNNLVPTFRYNIPGTDKYYIGINDIPYFDATDLFIMIPLIILPFIYLKKRYMAVQGFDKLEILLLLLLLIIGSFLIAKIAEYWLYMHSSSQLGLSAEQAIAIRESFIEKTEASKAVLLIVSVMGGLAILLSLRKKKK